VSDANSFELSYVEWPTTVEHQRAMKDFKAQYEHIQNTEANHKERIASLKS
jgi:hypothetical protein